MTKKYVALILAFALILTVTCSFSFVEKDDAHVVSSEIIVPDQYSTIQEAINNAVDGDTIFVRTGTYYEHVVVSKIVSLLGEDASTTIIDGNETGRVIDIMRDNVNITGFTVQRGGTAMLPRLDGGVCLYGATGCTISGNNIVNSGLFGIHVLNGKQNAISGNNITGCLSGILTEEQTYYNVISQNNIYMNEYGFYVESSQNFIYHNNVLNNTHQTHVALESVNMWDDGYPSGGNYWSDYNGTDADGDGIGDAQYVIAGDIVDRYPLINPWTRFLGDVNDDGKVDIYDAILLSNAFSSEPGDPKWNPNADINGDNAVDIYDAIILANNFGKQRT